MLLSAYECLPLIMYELRLFLNDTMRFAYLGVVLDCIDS